MSPFAYAISVLAFTIGLSSSTDPRPYMLPSTSTPSSYDITLTIDPNSTDSTFAGRVSITIKALTSASNAITLHADDLEIKNVAVFHSWVPNENLYSNHTTSNNDTNFLEIQLRKNMVESQEYEVRLDYIGYFGQLRGIYRSSYLDANNNLRYLIATQFAPANARKAFPCYDEPALKSQFKFNIYAPDGYYVISNMFPTTSTLPRVNEFYPTSFTKTPNMSTYILGFVVSDFKFKTNNAQDIFVKPLKIYSRSQVINHTELALEVAQKSMSLLQNYTAFAYNMPKLDKVALPDFLFNAMENWGIVTYKEEVLLYDPKETPTSLKQKLATVISHENAHMWFGNQVTPAWWGYVWMKEGFASYFEAYITDLIFQGSWRLMDQFVVESLHEVMQQDSLESTEPMNSSVATPSEFMANYDAIAYQKGASIIRMMRHILTEPVFQTAIRDYVKTLDSKVSTPSDLNEAFDSAAINATNLPINITVGDIMDSWTEQAGYPVVYTKRDNSTILCIQKRYYQNPKTVSEEKWWIPINFVTSSSGSFNDTSASIWLSPLMNLSLTINAADDWYILNTQQTGYYRIMYDEANWKELTKILMSSDYESIHPINRAQLIDDAFEFSKSGKMSYNITLDMISYLKFETDYIPWVAAKRGFNYLNGMMKDSLEISRYQIFVRNITEKMYQSVGFESKPNDDHITLMMRAVATNLACGVRHVDCITKMKEKADMFINETLNYIEPDLRSLIYCQAARDSPAGWDFMWKRYQNTTTASERTILLNSLGCTDNDNIMDRYLNMSIDASSDIRSQDRHIVVESLIRSSGKGINSALKFLLANFDKLQQMAVSSSGTIKVINALGNGISTNEQMSNFSAFVTKYQETFSAGEARAAQRAASIIESNKIWLKEILKDVDSWLEDNVYIPPNSALVLKPSLIVPTLVLVLNYLYATYF